MTERFIKIREAAKKSTGVVHVSGLSEGRTAPVLSVLTKAGKRQILILTATQARAKVLCEDLRLFTDRRIYLFPEEEQVLLNYDAKSHGDLEVQMQSLIALSKGEPCVIVASCQAAMQKRIPRRVFLNAAVTLNVGETYPLGELQRRLSYMGYEKVQRVEGKGQFCCRGDILDLFLFDHDYPIRIEFFDDEVDSLRSFNPDTQRSLDSLESAAIYPAALLIYGEEEQKRAEEMIIQAYEKQRKKLTSEEALENLESRKNTFLENIRERMNNQSIAKHASYFYSDLQTLADYMKKDGIVVIEDYARASEKMGFCDRELKEAFQIQLERGKTVGGELQDLLLGDAFSDTVNGGNRLVFLLTPFSGGLKGVNSLDEVIGIRAKPVTGFSGRMDYFLEEIRRYVKDSFSVRLFCSSGDRMDNLKEYLNRNDVFSVEIVSGTLSGGSEYPDEKLVLISDQDVFATQKIRKTKAQRRDAKPIRTYTDIQKGDYVVHENHGIGRFVEIRQLDMDGNKSDFLMIQYGGADILYVPVDQMDRVQKYIGADGHEPRLNKLSGTEWKKTKQKVKTAIQEMARELIELTASRMEMKGYAFGPDVVWQSEFESQFPYVETDDQLRCAEEIKKDMEQSHPMDRLLCGDVGFGKTEVAARAVFKCIVEGKQAAILVPTTILANQHYNTFKERIGNFPFEVEMLSRFRTAKQQKEIVEKLKQGKVDIIIGTHRLLSEDVQFHDLGLLVIDEEQRFGVQHKERIKLLREDVDVLTLSATPIPRTLHMSLIGARDMSLIEEPPEERYPVQTYVMEQDADVISGAIRKELERGGQSFVVFNRVKEIRRMAAYISDLVPEARISIGHGQMGETALENVIIDFIEQKSDVLVCTTIIETGIDMPNVNTLIILDADRYGLSQLYQLRGRVGRSNRLSYAYLLYQKDKVLTEVAEKRLTAVREFTELGSGFKLSMRDLELRGAGNLLGTAQHGHMAEVGYELYCKMLADTMKAFRGEKPEEQESMETSVELEVSAYLPAEYIDDPVTKVEIYQKIASILTEDDQSEMIDELIDRFGAMPQAVDNLIGISRIKKMLEGIGVQKVTEKKGMATFYFCSIRELKAELVKRIVRVYPGKCFVQAGRMPFIRYELKDKKYKVRDILEFVSVLVGAGHEDSE